MNQWFAKGYKKTGACVAMKNTCWILIRTKNQYPGINVT
jgi:hypothetical protein